MREIGDGFVEMIGDADELSQLFETISLGAARVANDVRKTAHRIAMRYFEIFAHAQLAKHAWHLKFRMFIVFSFVDSNAKKPRNGHQ